jgi:hypothetical protein
MRLIYEEVDRRADLRKMGSALLDGSNGSAEVAACGLSRAESDRLLQTAPRPSGW